MEKLPLHQTDEAIYVQNIMSEKGLRNTQSITPQETWFSEFWERKSHGLKW